MNKFAIYILFVVFTFWSTTLFCQVVNIESVRKLNDSSKFIGAARLDFNFAKDVNTVFELTNEIRFQYLFGKNKLLFINDFSFKKLNGNQFNNRNLQHIRYSYLLNKIVALEGFG